MEPTPPPGQGGGDDWQAGTQRSGRGIHRRFSLERSWGSSWYRKRRQASATLDGVKRRAMVNLDMYVDVRYHVYMVVPITQFRKAIFSLTEAALDRKST